VGSGIKTGKAGFYGAREGGALHLNLLLTLSFDFDPDFYFNSLTPLID
jgi:hypothetical protein